MAGVVFAVWAMGGGAAEPEKEIARLRSYVDDIPKKYIEHTYHGAGLTRTGHQFLENPPEIVERDLKLLYDAVAKLPEKDSQRPYFQYLIDIFESTLFGGKFWKDLEELNERLGNVYAECFENDFAVNPLRSIPLDTFPEMDGSTSTLPLRLIVAAFLLEQRPSWIDESAFKELSEPIYEYYPNYFSGPASTRQARYAYTLLTNRALTPNRKTGKSYQRIQIPSGDLVINAVSPAAVPEVDAGKLEYKIIAYDALVAILHRANPTDNLTLEQIRRIYSSDFSLRWSHSSKPIQPLSRNADSGTAILMRDLLFQGAMPAQKMTAHKTVMEMGLIIDALKNNYDAIGFSVYYYEKYIHPTPYAKVPAINGVKPTFESIADGSYPLRAPIYAAINKNEPAESPARKIYDFLTTPEAQKIIRAAGYIPL